LTTADNLAQYLSGQGKYDETEKMDHEVLAVRKRVLGADHPETLSTAGDLAASPAGQGNVDEIQSGSIRCASELEVYH
jgi:hypothetical protein